MLALGVSEGVLLVRVRDLGDALGGVSELRVFCE